jgi:hypothetical protein
MASGQSLGNGDVQKHHHVITRVIIILLLDIIIIFFSSLCACLSTKLINSATDKVSVDGANELIVL